MKNSENYIFTVNITQPERIDIFLANKLPGYSRSFCQKLIQLSCVTLNGQPLTKASTLVQTGDQITVRLPERPIPPSKPQQLDIPIVYEHPDFLIINKPAGLLVHRPLSTSTTFSLVEWLAGTPGLIHYSLGERPGIVHRLDKNTSGLMLIARTLQAQAYLSDLFKQRKIKKTYLAVVAGHPAAEGTINYPIQRDPHIPIKMTHRYPQGREAITHYRVQKYFDQAALVEAQPVTGRTHQIRVHFAGAGHPIIGDSVYGTASKLIKRQALHAFKLEFTYKDQNFSFIQEPPEDFNELVTKLAS